MKRNKFDSEYILHKLTERNLKILFDLEFVASEIQLNKLRIDTLAFDEKTKTFVIIEYKNESNLNVINQAQEYCDLVKNNPEYFADRLDNRSDIVFENTRVMIIGPEFSPSQINNSNDNFEIWKVSLYDSGKVVYENMKTGETTELMTSPEELELTEEKILIDKPQEICDLFLNFKEKVMSEFSDIKLIYLVNAVSFRANNRIACIFRLETPAKIHYHSDELKDIENKTRDISNISTGAKANYELILKSEDDIDYALDLFRQVYLQKVTVKMNDYKTCSACQTENSTREKYCLNCGQKLIDDKENEIILNDKLPIPKDKIILLDLNYTLISNSWKIRHDRLPQKIFNRQYEHELVNKIKNNYVILITASPYYTSFDSLKHIEENTDLKIDESYWNFGKRPQDLKRYWLEKAVLPTHGDNPDKYLAIESNEDTREMYAGFGIDARSKRDFI